MSGPAAELARRLARDAEAVCRYYLSNGRRQGRYWIVGDVQNTPGRSLYVRLHGPEFGPGAAGKWTDAATGEHGDLLDLIALNRGLDRLGDILGEARSFLSLPRTGVRSGLRASHPRRPDRPRRRAACSAPAARSSARRPKPISARAASRRRSTGRACATIRRSITARMKARRARSGRRCWPPSPTSAAASPASIAPGSIPPHRSKAPLADPRRALGHLLGNGVRFGVADRRAGRGRRASRPCSR